MSLISEIEKGESKKLEFKETFPESSKISKTVIAFSNGAGGKLIIGVSDSREIVGISDDDVFEFSDKISNIINDSCYPMIIPEIYSENINGKNVVIVQIYPGNFKPYYLKKLGKNNGTYIRIGATNKRADQELIMELERQRRNISFDEECMYEYSLSDMDIEKLKKDFFNYTGRELNEQALFNMKLVKEENGKKYPTRALALLASRSNIFEFARIKCARFKGLDTEEFIDQKEFSGPLYDQIENAMSFAKTHIKKHGKIAGLQRIDEYDIPIVAIREAIANAIVHRDYSISGSDIKFAIFDDRMEITSPGFLPKTLDIDDIKMGRSEIRNKVIARFFKEIGFIEEWGTGIKRIISSCNAMNLREPQFIETGMFFKVIIYNTGNDKVAVSSDKVAIGSDKVAIDNDNITKYDIETNKNEKAILQYLQKEKNINSSKAREITGLSPAGVRKIFESLRKKNIIIPVGENKCRYYLLNNKR